MGKVFSDKVEQALQYIYYNERAQKGAEGRDLLVEAVNEGDADAMCILARCCCGSQYVWEGHDFPEQDEEATKLLHQSVKSGSAVGVLVALRSGELTPALMKKMPFQNLQEAFDKVESMAAQGDAFCQYTVANSYFWWDFLRIQNKGRDSFQSDQEFKAYLKENILKCEDWFWKAYRGGMYFAGHNLNRLYSEGDEDIVLPQPEKAKDIWRIGAEYGYPLEQYIYARELDKADQKKEALAWYQKAAEGGQMDAYFYVGDAYESGELVPQDKRYAAECYEKCLMTDWANNHVGSANSLGELYFRGEGVPQDYAKSYQNFLWVYQDTDGKNTWGMPYMAQCCFYGLGTQQDYALAKKYLEKIKEPNRKVNYMLGYLHCNGLGGLPVNIKKGVEYLQKSGTEEAKEELLKYKKTFFGKWVRR